MNSATPATRIGMRRARGAFRDAQASRRAIAALLYRTDDRGTTDRTFASRLRRKRIARVLPFRDEIGVLNTQCFIGSRFNQEQRMFRMLLAKRFHAFSLTSFHAPVALDLDPAITIDKEIRAIGRLGAVFEGNEKRLALIAEALPKQLQHAGVIGFPARAEVHPEIGPESADAIARTRRASMRTWPPGSPFEMTSLAAEVLCHAAITLEWFAALLANQIKLSALRTTMQGMAATGTELLLAGIQFLATMKTGTHKPSIHLDSIMMDGKGCLCPG